MTRSSIYESSLMIHGSDRIATSLTIHSPIVWVLFANALSRFPDTVKSLYNTPHYNMGFRCNIVCMFCLPIFLPWNWFKLYFICIIYDKYTNNTEYDYNTTTIQMRFRRKSNDLFESVFQEFTLLIYVLSCHSCHLCRE